MHAIKPLVYARLC